MKENSPAQYEQPGGNRGESKCTRQMLGDSEGDASEKLTNLIKDATSRWITELELQRSFSFIEERSSHVAREATLRRLFTPTNLSEKPPVDETIKRKMQIKEAEFLGLPDPENATIEEVLEGSSLQWRSIMDRLTTDMEKAREKEVEEKEGLRLAKIAIDEELHNIRRLLSLPERDRDTPMIERIKALLE